ncbi:MAG: HlyD family secretion protein [Deltaproteobacteria bacterium]|nr:HlyD family secretion protein [Deltaproteobacteria bacterium]
MQPDSVEIKNRNRRRGKIALFIFAFLLISGFIIGFFVYKYRQTHVATDDAFVEGTIYTIAPKVSGPVLAVQVIDNQPVKKGDLLVRINPERYEVKLAEEEAKLVSAKKLLVQTGKAVEAARAGLRLAEAERSQAKLDYDRAKSLYASEAIPKSDFDRAKTADEVASAALAAKEADLGSVESSLETIKANIRSAEASVADAQLSIDYTYVKAPGDGYVTRKNVQPGNFLSVGQPVMAVVSTDGLWVVANYKETQIEHMRVSDPVEIRVDTYRGKKLQGRIESFMAGTGSAFSLFPPENATGNYVKVVQRVPVKIVFTEPIPEGVNLRVGMSVTPTVFVSR